MLQRCSELGSGGKMRMWPRMGAMTEEKRLVKGKTDG